jgi:hypothetical protein
MQPQCPEGTSLLGDTFACGYPCESGTVPFNQDDAFCVTTECPPQSTKDSIDNSICNKSSIAVQGFGCANGYTEWIPGRCFLDCPVAFRENGQTCLIPLRRRQLAEPQCPYLFVLSGEKCKPSSTFLWLLSLAVVLIGIIAFVHPWRKRRAPD